MADRKRIVITGVGLVTSLGTDTELVWDRLKNSVSGIRKIDRFDVDDLECKIGGVVHMNEGSTQEDSSFDASRWFEEKDVKKVDSFILFGLAAADLALRDSGILECNLDPDRVGTLVGSGIGGLPFIEKNVAQLYERGPRRVSPFFVPGSLINLLPGNISIKYGFSGYCNAVVAACASGAVAIADAARVLSSGEADVVIAGGAESALCRSGIAGFSVIKALSTKFNDTPEAASRPWDIDRDGFVMGEGAGIVVMESYEHAKKRNAKIYAELSGFGVTSDAYHITSPHPEGLGGANAMRKALDNAMLAQDSIDYINAHGTSTPVGDSVEISAVKDVFQDHAYQMAISSTKSSIGHLLGAAGSVEAIFSMLAIRDNVAPPTLNLHTSSEDPRLNLVPMVAQERPISRVLSNSFGFGGVNVSLIFSAV